MIAVLLQLNRVDEEQQSHGSFASTELKPFYNVTFILCKSKPKGFIYAPTSHR